MIAHPRRAGRCQGLLDQEAVCRIDEIARLGHARVGGHLIHGDQGTGRSVDAERVLQHRGAVRRVDGGVELRQVGLQ